MATQSGNPPVRYQIINGVKMPKFFSPDAIKSAFNLKLQPEDVILCTYPKSGTNWTEQIVQLLRNNGKPAKSGLEFMMACPFVEMLGADALDKQVAPRFCKVHFDYHNVPKCSQAKYIVVIRNPKDTLISLYHFLNTDVHDHQGGGLNSFFQNYIRGDIAYGDYFDHLLSWYEHRQDDNVLFLYYEKMKRDLKSSVIEIARFLGDEYITLVEQPKVLEDILHFSSFQYMKENTSNGLDSVYKEYGFSAVDIDASDLPSGLKYSLKQLKNRPMTDGGRIRMVRKGVVGDGKESLSAEMNDQMDHEIEERLKGTEMFEYWKTTGCI